ncbi:MAG: cysteine desulfurase [Clostridia bacterium]|nr:cysteine desulfurase [Clostridia bacterium]
MIYLDNSATTPLCREAREAMLYAMDRFGNPSSLHKVGQEAAGLVADARSGILKTLGVRNPADGVLVFTGSGTEASNLALQGTVQAKARHAGKTILTTDSEHPSVENQMKRFESEGYRVVRIGTGNGKLDLDAVDRELESNDVFLASFMLVNNETGAVYDVAEAFARIQRKNPGAITHCDAVQGYLKCEYRPEKLHADLMTLSAHKIGGPKGIGALYVRQDILKRKYLSPLILGGGQEKGFRSGTENVIGIAGFGAAAKAVLPVWKENGERTAGLRLELKERLTALGFRVNEPETAAPHILSVTLPDIKSETMLHFLSAKGICVSSGSACSSHAKEVSRALTAFGLNAHDADCTVRISFGPDNTEEDVRLAAEALKEGMDTLVRIRK